VTAPVKTSAPAYVAPVQTKAPVYSVPVSSSSGAVWIAQATHTTVGISLYQPESHQINVIRMVVL